MAQRAAISACAAAQRAADTGQRARRVHGIPEFIEDRAFNRADGDTLSVSEITDALGAFVRVDQEVRLGLEDRLFGQRGCRRSSLRSFR